MDIATGRRDKGVYIIRTVGMQGWAEGDGTWKAHGVRLELLDGPSLLAVCKLEVPGAVDAEERGTEEAQRIDPWVRTLRYLATARSLREQFNRMEILAERAEADGLLPMLDDLKDEVIASADASEIEQANAADGFDPLGGSLARIVAGRLRGQVTTALKAALAFAPSVAESPIHPAWERPPMIAASGTFLAQDVARDLLAAWAAVRDLRDPLVAWAVQGAKVTRSEVQATTGISRSTINRLLPTEAH